MALIHPQIVQSLASLGLQSYTLLKRVEKSPTLSTYSTNSPVNSTNRYGARSDKLTFINKRLQGQIPTLAHELTHSSGSHYQEALKRKLTSYADALDYANSRAMGEGEALYYEFKVAQELGERKNYASFRVGKSTASRCTQRFSPTNHDHYRHDSTTWKISQLGDLNKDMIPSGMVNKAEEQTMSANRVYHIPVPTYYEFNILKFLGNK